MQIRPLLVLLASLLVGLEAGRRGGRLRTRGAFSFASGGNRAGENNQLNNSTLPDLVWIGNDEDLGESDEFSHNQQAFIHQFQEATDRANEGVPQNFGCDTVLSNTI